MKKNIILFIVFLIVIILIISSIKGIGKEVVNIAYYEGTSWKMSYDEFEKLVEKYEDVTIFEEVILDKRYNDRVIMYEFKNEFLHSVSVTYYENFDLEEAIQMYKEEFKEPHVNLETVMEWETSDSFIIITIVGEIINVKYVSNNND